MMLKNGKICLNKQKKLFLMINLLMRFKCLYYNGKEMICQFLNLLLVGIQHLQAILDLKKEIQELEYHYGYQIIALNVIIVPLFVLMLLLDLICQIKKSQKRLLKDLKLEKLKGLYFYKNNLFQKIYFIFKYL